MNDVPAAAARPELRVLVVSADPLAGAGVAALVAAQPAHVVVGLETVETDLDAAIAARPADVVLWDLGEDARRALERLAGVDEIPVPVVALAPDATAGAQALAAGARGVLARTTDADRLLACLRAAGLGLVVYDPAAAAGAWGPRDRGGALFDDLTPREAEVLRLLAEGLSNKTIADRLGISDHTAKYHVAAVMSKLGAATRTEAVARAARLGLIFL